jgi:cytosine/adenosine deaminase-related metal-dependent hydrolase
MKLFAEICRCAFTLAGLSIFPVANAHAADDWTISGTVLAPGGIIADGAVSISGQMITAVGPSASISGAATVKVPGVILPGFIDLHNHLTWNVLPRWVPARKFNNRYEWQDTAEYDRVLVAPHNVVMASAACEAEIYAEIKALAGGATSVIGGLLRDPQHPDNDNAKCVVGLARNLDTDSGLPFKAPPDTECPTDAGTDRTLLNVVENAIFPMELMHGRMDFLLCELGTGTLRSMVVHLSEGAATDSAAHREYNMLSKEVLLQKDGKTAIEREGLLLIHGTALRDPDFAGMKRSKLGLIWSPRSNDELYGSTANIAAARQAGVEIAIAPDWSPSGSAGMLQEIGYAARRYGAVNSAELVAMATSTPAKMARISDYVGALAPHRFADFVVVNVKVDPTKPNPLDPVAKATAADVALVVVGGQPLYGDKALLAQVLPAGTKTDEFTVCGAQKAVYLGQSEAGARGWSFDDIRKRLNAALAKGSSSLPEIECD